MKNGKSVLEIGTSALANLGQAKPGLQMSSIHFSGKWGNRVELPSLILNHTDFTLEAWVKPASGEPRLNTVIGACQIGQKWNGSGTLLGFKNGDLWNGNFFDPQRGAQNLESPGTITGDNWYHVAISKSGDTSKLFVNGKQEDQVVHKFIYVLDTKD